MTVAVSLRAKLFTVAHCERHRVDIQHTRETIKSEPQPDRIQTSAVDFTIRTLAAVHRVQILLALATLEASLMVGLREEHSTDKETDKVTGTWTRPVSETLVAAT